ncbi:Hypothetical protein NocV09_00501500 [Nannochloropsis oceanica]
MVVYKFLRCCTVLLTFFLQKASVWGCFKSLFDLAFGWLIPHGISAWVSVLLVVIAQGLSMMSRYNCMFGGADCPSVRTALFAAHAVAGLLASAAFLIRAGGPGGEGIYNACEWRHHGTAVVLAGMVSSLLDAWVYDQRGYQSAHGLGPFRRAPPRGRKTHLILARGYDQRLFDLHYFVPGVGSGESEEMRLLEEDMQCGRRSPHSRMLLPHLPPQQKLPSFVSPHSNKWARWAGNHVMRLWFYWENLQGGELVSRVCVGVVGVAMAVWPVEAALGWVGSVVFGEDHHYEILPPSVGSSWQALPTVAWTTVLVLWYVGFSLAGGTLLLCHLVRQPVDFSGFDAGVGSVGVLQHWLAKGWTVLLRDPGQQRMQQQSELGGLGRRRSDGAPAAAVRGEEMWQVELEDTQRVLYRVAVLANKSVYPPRLTTHSQLARQGVSVTEKLYRAHAFLDLAILAHTNAGRRREVCFREMPRWRDACRPLLMVVNALTLQLELQMEGGGRLEGGTASPMKGMCTRLGLEEPRDGKGLAALIIDSEVQRRMEEVWAKRRRQGRVVTVEEMQKARSEQFHLPARLVGGVGGGRGGKGKEKKQILSPLALPMLDLQVVELAASALAGLYRYAVEMVEEGEGGREGGFEDSRGCSRHSIPSVIGALVSCQLAMHLYSYMVLCEGGEEGGAGGTTRKGGVARFQVILDRPSVVLPQLVGVSLAVDDAIEEIVEKYYDSDFATFSFAPLYARCVKMYVECGRRKVGEGGQEGGVAGEVGGMGEGGSPSLLRKRRA